MSAVLASLLPDYCMITDGSHRAVADITGHACSHCMSFLAGVTVSDLADTDACLHQIIICQWYLGLDLSTAPVPPALHVNFSRPHHPRKTRQKSQQEEAEDTAAVPFV